MSGKMANLELALNLTSFNISSYKSNGNVLPFIGFLSANGYILIKPQKAINNQKLFMNKENKYSLGADLEWPLVRSLYVSYSLQLTSELSRFSELFRANVWGSKSGHKGQVLATLK